MNITDQLDQKAALIEARAAVRKLESTTTQPMRKLTGNADRIREKFHASKARNQAVADQLAAEEIEKMKQAKVAAAPAAKPAAPAAPAATKTDAPAATKPRKPTFAHLHGLERAQAIAKYEAGLKAKAKAAPTAPSTTGTVTAAEFLAGAPGRRMTKAEVGKLLPLQQKRFIDAGGKLAK